MGKFEQLEVVSVILNLLKSSDNQSNSAKWSKHHRLRACQSARCPPTSSGCPRRGDLLPRRNSVTVELPRCPNAVEKCGGVLTRKPRRNMKRSKPSSRKSTTLSIPLG